METVLIVLLFAGVPLALFVFIIFGATHRARQNKMISDAADKYIKT